MTIEQKLCVACKEDDVELVKQILEKNSNINLNATQIYGTKGRNGTPLILTGSKEIGELLLAAGASINYINPTGNYTALDSINETIMIVENALKNVELNNGEEEIKEKKDILKKLIKIKR